MLTSTFSDQDVISNVSNIYNLLNNDTVRHLVYMILFYPHNKICFLFILQKTIVIMISASLKQHFQLCVFIFFRSFLLGFIISETGSIMRNVCFYYKGPTCICFLSG